MNINLKRNKSKADFTTGKLFIDGVFECYTLEDEYREVKVMHETRIPAGTYPIILRTFGGHHERYKVKFPDIHKGMLWLQDVPNFHDILIHIGNTDEDTSGCILVGAAVNEQRGILYQSTQAYLKLYPKVLLALINLDPVTITIVDHE